MTFRKVSIQKFRGNYDSSDGLVIVKGSDLRPFFQVSSWGGVLIDRQQMDK
jgi:hypothetical protein